MSTPDQNFKSYGEIIVYTDSMRFAKKSYNLEGVIQLRDYKSYIHFDDIPGNAFIYVGKKIFPPTKLKRNVEINLPFNLSPNMIVAGGYIVNQLLDITNYDNDIDIFQIKYDEKEISEASDLLEYNYCYITDKAITFSLCDYTNDIQFIRKHARSVSNLLYSFDMAICQCCMWEGEIYMTYECAIELYYRRIFLNKFRMQFTTYYRLKKYMTLKECTLNFSQTGIILDGLYNMLCIVPDFSYGAILKKQNYVRRILDGTLDAFKSDSMQDAFDGKQSIEMIKNHISAISVSQFNQESINRVINYNRDVRLKHVDDIVSICRNVDVDRAIIGKNIRYIQSLLPEIEEIIFSYVLFVTKGRIPLYRNNIEFITTY